MTETPPAFTGRTLIDSGTGDWARNDSYAIRVSWMSRSAATTSRTGAHMVAIRLASSPPTDCVVAIASSRSASSRRARSSSALPATVSSTRWVERRSSSQPSSRSSARIWRLSAGWERYRRVAARLKLSSSATAMNARR